MSAEQIERVQNRPTQEYLVRSRDYRVQETFATRDQRYQAVDEMLRGEWGYALPGDNVVVEEPMVMNLGEAFAQDVARMTTEQVPVYKAPVYGDGTKDAESGQLREVIGETYWHENRGDMLIPQYAMDLVVCGAAYSVSWVPKDGEYPMFTRVDPRHCYPSIHNGNLVDLLIIQVYPAALADALFPDLDIYNDAASNDMSSDVEIWDYHTTGYSCKLVAHMKADGGIEASHLKEISSVSYDLDCPPVSFVKLSSHDGAIRGMLDQLGTTLRAKNKIASLMAKYTEHKLYASWEQKGILNPGDTPGPNTVYHHDPNAPGDTFMRRVEPAGSDPALFALMNLLDLDQRGAIGYPGSRQGEVSQSIASGSFVESSQGQLSSIVKDIQRLEGDLREQTTQISFKLDKGHMDFEKPLMKAVNKKSTYKPSKDIGDKTKIRIMYGAGAGMSRQNADARVLNMLGARVIDRGTVRDNIEFLRDRADMQDKVEMENAEDSLQQIFWPDPNVPMDIKFKVKNTMAREGLSLSEAWEKVQVTMQEEMAAQQEAQAQAQGAMLPPEQVQPDAADQQALALEKGAIVQEPADIELPPAPMEQIFISSE